MEESTSREKVLKKIRHALIYKTDNPFPYFEVDSPVYQPIKESLDVNFAEKFYANGGVFLYCESEVELTASLAGLFNECNWENIYCNDPAIQFYLNSVSIPYESDKKSSKDIDVSIVSCEFLISQTGSIALSSKFGRNIITCPHTLVVVAYTNQLVNELDEALELFQIKYRHSTPSMFTIISGTGKNHITPEYAIPSNDMPSNVFLLLVESNQ